MIDLLCFFLIRIWLDQVVETRVRLTGVDAPEMKGRCIKERAMAIRARNFVRGHIGHGSVVLHDVRYGKYAGRVLARIEDAAGIDLGRALLDAGLARTYASGHRESWCAAVVGETGDVN